MCEECPNLLYSNKTICKSFPESNREDNRSKNFGLTKSFAFDIGKVSTQLKSKAFFWNFAILEINFTQNTKNKECFQVTDYL